MDIVWNVADMSKRRQLVITVQITITEIHHKPTWFT